MTIIVISELTCYLAAGILLLGLGLFKSLRDSGNSNEAPGPRRWPVIGNLHLLRGYKIPYQGFVDLSNTYGKVYGLRLGKVPALVVQGIDNIREVLVQRSHQFDSRPNFDRYHQLFHGNRQNSLAFCDWSNVQKKRRDLLKDHVFPKSYSNNFDNLNRIICEEIKKLIHNVRNTTGSNSESDRDNEAYETGYVRTVINRITKQLQPNIKIIMSLIQNKHVETIVRLPRYPKTPLTSNFVPEYKNHAVSIKNKILPACANIFLRYFCSVDMGTKINSEFAQFVEDFDQIFYEVNQGYACDFLPFLGTFYKKNIRRVQKHSESIRSFVLKHLIGQRLNDDKSVANDYVDALIKSVKHDAPNERLSMESALFSLEDIIGGHTAIGNFLVKLLTFLVDNKPILNKIREEVKAREKDFVTLEDKHHMPYTEAVIMEALRMVSSPIVPHVSNQDTTVSGYRVQKGTLVFLNNYELNMSDRLWSNPLNFDPSRFINKETGSKTKPVHFLPFGIGKRSCMGYKLVQFVSFVFVANMVNQFDVCSVPGERYDQVNLGNLSAKSYKFEFRAR